MWWWWYGGSGGVEGEGGAAYCGGIDVGVGAGVENCLRVIQRLHNQLSEMGVVAVVV